MAKGSPMNRSRRQLEWVQRNHPSYRSDHVGTLARQVMESQIRKGFAWRRNVFALLEEHAGAELLIHVAGIDLYQGVLKLEVTEPAAAYHLGMLWEQRLLELYQTRLPAAGVHTVRFIARAKA